MHIQVYVMSVCSHRLIDAIEVLKLARSDASVVTPSNFKYKLAVIQLIIQSHYPNPTSKTLQS